MRVKPGFQPGSIRLLGSRLGRPSIYPVDILEDDPERHREAALAYYATLREGMQPSEELFSLPTGEQVKLEASSVCFCTVHRDEPQHKILVLVNPQDTKTVVAVYIKESWWPTEDVLRTSDPAREGLLKVQSFGERIVLFILNVVIFGRLERNLDDRDMFFLPHSVKEQAKILWRDGSAVGFYTTKRKGSLCGDGTGACYLLPVFDTVFVRRMYRRQGLGMAMLQDFCETFREDEALGVSWPISPAMYQVCRKFLLAHPEERGRLWEVEPPGAWGQRGSIWLKVRLQQSRPPDSHPGDAKDDMSSQGQTTPDEGPGHSEEGKKERTPGEREERKSDQDCGVEETAAGWLGGACGAQPAGKEAKRTAVEAGLAWESQQKHLRPSS
ncbi:protein FAM169B-like isoform X2 [Mustela lutreola]|uniref:protein FAM169B-like isoform X2 n=1 Tax=Mustela lutreola TaxID=9666 RepID=UPI0027972052|nr:protein FAM169B-like isoform X2 [Mustela lutreola]